MSKFKVGDKVRRTAYSSILEVGGEYVISEVRKTSYKTYLRLKDREGTWGTQYFELVEPKPQFKVGDKVRVIDDAYSGGMLVKGEEHTVIEVGGSERPGWSVHLDKMDYIKFWREDRFELVEEKMKFKVGDKVRVIDDRTAGYHLKLGQEFVIADINHSSRYGGSVKVEGVEGYWWESRFESVEEAKVNDIKVGDTVHVDYTATVTRIYSNSLAVKIDNGLVYEAPTRFATKVKPPFVWPTKPGAVIRDLSGIRPIYVLSPEGLWVGKSGRSYSEESFSTKYLEVVSEGVDV